MKKIRAAVVGYGNIGQYTLQALEAAGDFEVAGIVRRHGAENKPAELAQYEVVKDIRELKDVDVAILATPSRSCEEYAKQILPLGINTVDSFDNHAKIHEHFQKVDAAAQKGGRLAVIAAGWDPGLFSLSRMLAEALLPCGESYTFWGRGISQGHSDAVRSIEGILDARQYTIPKEDVLKKIRTGEICNALSDRQCHRRECFVVCEDGGNPKKIRRKILHMPDYFEGYETEVHFISQEELQEKHSKMPHGGTVIRVGKTGGENKAVYDFSLKMDSNPEFTGAVLTAYARAAYRLAAEGESGCRTVFDIPPLLLSPYGQESLIKKFL